MNNRAMNLQAKNKNIHVTLIPGHFSTSHSHINYLIDMTELKCEQQMARTAAKDLSAKLSNTPVDTILCLERTTMPGAFLAHELSDKGINQHQKIHVFSPEVKNGNQILVRENLQPMIWSKHVLVFTASVTTGMTAASAVEAVRYYGGNPMGIVALFSKVRTLNQLPVYSIFTEEDIPGYETYSIADCPLCKNGAKLDALVNSYGYSKF